MACTRSVARRGTFQVNVKRSKFIGTCQRCLDEESARTFIKEVCALYSSADHNCWAYKLSVPGRALSNYSDAGEPRGSAGLPILGAVERLELTDVTVVVTRYFGGTKLGMRGLIEAYGSTAEGSLKAGEIRLFCPGISLHIELSYSQWNDLTRLLREGADFKTMNVNYTDRVRATVAVREPAGNSSDVVDFLEERRIRYVRGEEVEFSNPVQ